VRRLASLLVLTVATLVTVTPVQAVSSAPSTPQPGTPYTVLQMNLCLSGTADCYSRTAYPAIVQEAAEQVMAQDPQAVTLNEACRGDATDIARRAGYRMRFTAVLVRGEPLPCVAPVRRGVFGLAVLTRARITTSHDQPFAGQVGPEKRRWLCVTTARAISVCTAHLGTRESAEAISANDAECAELRAVLARYDGAGTTVFGGDVNRREPCAPDGMWTGGDTAAAQAPGIQHIYGSLSLHGPVARVSAATYTDHDFFLATGQAAVGSSTVVNDMVAATTERGRGASAARVGVVLAGSKA
jgi:endonuclease/exonuclease/phosphatase family metal-dependent hydrolase